MRQEANKRLAILFDKLGINYCEVCPTDTYRFTNCNQFMGLTFSHRKKRRHYRTVEELSDLSEVVLSCAYSHNITERDPELTKKVFGKLRGGK